MERREDVSGINRISWYLKKWLIAGKFFIPYLRIRKGTRRGQPESQEKENRMACKRNSISTDQHYDQIAERGKTFVSWMYLLLNFLRL